jgi:hypothetical protein
MVYSLEILKRRHLELIGLRRKPAPEDEPEEAVERVLSADRG